MSTSNQYQIARWRLGLVALALGVVAILLMGRIALLQVWPDYERGFAFLQAQGEARSNRELVIPAVRGMILDRHGRPLAVSTPVVSLWADPQLVSIDEDRLRAIADIIDVPFSALEVRLAPDSGSRFVYLKRGMVPELADSLRPLIGPGVFLMEEFRRYYPAGEVASQLVGFTDIDERGQEGVELSLNSILDGEPGSRRIVRDLQGKVIESPEIIQPAKPGDDVVLTIDARLQYAAYRQLKAAVTAHGAASGSLVTMDVHTGEVLAMVNQPAFNPNVRSEIQPAAVRNRVLTDVLEPGSTIKPFTVLAGLESGRYRPDTPLQTSPGYIDVGAKRIYDPVNYGELSVTDVVVKSSQVGTAQIALDLDPDNLASLLQRVGLGVMPGMGFPGEAAGSVPQRFNWQPIEQVTMSYGYGLSVSLMQLAQAYAVLGNGGYRVTPRLYRDASFPPPELVAEPGLVAEVLEMLRATVERGTASLAAAPSYDVAGKTGTVHLVGDAGYDAHRYRALFAGLAPANDPRIVTVVVIQDPKTDNYSGGSVAAPVFSAVAEASLQLLGVPPSGLVGSADGLVRVAP